MKLTLGFSTCPNDTFIFDAMVNGKIDTEGLSFECILSDVEELNRKAFNSELDITKLSYHAYAYIAEEYLLLNSGSALGHNNGPLLVSKSKMSLDKVVDRSIAIPGKFTTANLLLSIALPGATAKREYLFSDIEDAVLKGEVDAGLLIHENRFTYERRGLKKVADLGEYWENLVHLPIPLGGIAIKRTIPDKIALTVDRILARSVLYAMSNPDSSYEYMRKFAVSMEREIMNSHVELYVNNYTRDIGEDGRRAVERLYSEAGQRGIVPGIPQKIFVS